MQRACAVLQRAEVQGTVSPAAAVEDFAASSH